MPMIAGAFVPVILYEQIRHMLIHVYDLTIEVMKTKNVQLSCIHFLRMARIFNQLSLINALAVLFWLLRSIIDPTINLKNERKLIILPISDAKRKLAKIFQVKSVEPIVLIEVRR